MPDFRCICDWDKCQYVSQQFFLLANDGHPWKGPSLSWTKSTSKKIVILVKNQLFRAGVLQSLKIPEEEHPKISKRFRIARHHFPLSMWVEIGVTARLMSTLLTTDNVKRIDKLRSSNRSGEYRNSVQFLRTQTDQKFNDNDISALDGIYVCVPIQEQASTLVETKRLLDERTHVTTLANDNDTDYSTPNKSEEDRKPNVLRISTDKKVEHESDKKKQKIAHVPPTLDDPFPTPEIQREYLAQCYLQHYDADNLEPFAKSVRRTLNYVASEYHFDPDQQITIFELAPKAILHTCLSTVRLDGCELFTILQRATQRQLCFFCFELQRRCDRREKNNEITAVSRVQASSSVNFSSMSPPALRNRLRYMSKLIHSQNVTIRKYKLTLKEVREDECITFDKDQIPAVLEQVFEYMGSEEQNVQLETKILNVLLKSKLLKDEYNIQADHLKEYATRIGRMMGDECKKISGKQKSIKFDSRMMRTALVTFLEDGRKGLNKLRERSIECVPSLRTVQREYAHIRVGESWHCPLYCAMFYDVLADIGALKDRTTPVQLMFDEIKLKCGIWFNCTTNEIYGLTPTKNATSLNFAEEIEAMAEKCITEDNESPNVGPIDNLDDVCVNLDDEETSYVGAASKANVFRARTGKNQSWNIAYFLNCGSLDGDTIVKQILHVITCCEMAGLSVQGFVSDAGPNNVRAFTLITRGKCLKLCKGLLKKDSVSFRNPLTPEELIFIILCLVHGLKNMRNQFFIGRAPPEGKRKLVNNGNQIKWENITDLYDLVVSNQIESRCVRELPKLTFQAVDLDKWSKMNVHYAKVIFTDDTINYQLNILRQKLGLNSNFFDNIIQEYCVKIGFEAELLLDKISLLMEVVFADGSQVAKELKDMMAQIEFSGYVHFIFIARFLNKRAHLTLGREVREFRMTDGKIHLSLNINSERKAMEKCITYFDKWKVWMMGEEPRTWVVQKKHQLFVAHITYRNLKVAITGFLEYAENLLSKNTSIVFVPFLHSNQSSIEAFFSFMRSLSRDNARDISKALTTSNIQSDVKMASKKSTCYSNDDISNENETLKKAPYDSTTGPKRREEWLNEQIKKRDLEIVPNLGTKVLIFPKDVAAAADDSVRQFMNMVGTEETTESYSSLLLKTHSFREFAKLSSIGPARSWFENVMNGKQEGHFDTLCQQINCKLVNMLAKAGDAKSGAKNDDEKKAVSYQFQIWELVEKKDLEGLVSDTCPIGDRMGVIALIQILDEAIEQKLWAGMIERAELLRKNSNKEKPFHYRDVNSIFGWAVFHARKAKMKERFRRNDDEEKYAELTKEIEFLSAMRMYKSEAALSDHYLENCYHDTMRTSDRGHMTLVREEFFEFGYMLMDNLSSSVTEGKLLSKMEVLRLEKEAILNNTPLWEMWKVSSEKVQCVTEGDRKKMFEYVVKKTVHTKFEDVFKGLRGKLTSRGTKHNISGLSFRGEMKGMDRKKTVRTK